MEYKIVKKHENSKMCFTCGLENEAGLKASFFELESSELLAIIKPGDIHQGYTGKLHGGIAGAILDETIGRSIRILHRDIWGVTVELNIRYHKPVPLNEELKVVGRITKDTKRLFEGTGEILLNNGDIAVSAVGKYMKMTEDRISNL